MFPQRVECDDVLSFGSVGNVEVEVNEVTIRKPRVFHCARC